jgi:hypothetical protein
VGGGYSKPPKEK